MIETFRTKPRTVKAVRWTGRGDAFDAVVELLDGNRVDEEREWSSVYVRGVGKVAAWDRLSGRLTLWTVDGNKVQVGMRDWVMVDEAGHPYPCDRNVFVNYYEKMEELPLCVGDEVNYLGEDFIVESYGDKWAHIRYFSGGSGPVPIENIVGLARIDGTLITPPNVELNSVEQS